MSEELNNLVVDWNGIVKEVLKRRKTEKLSQKEHANLANVSVPTMSSFEKGDTTLSLSKAFDILRVVNMVYEPAPETLQDIFVRESYEDFISNPHNIEPYQQGWFRFDYYFEGCNKIMEEMQFKKKFIDTPFIINNHNFYASIKENKSLLRHSIDGRIFFLGLYLEDDDMLFSSERGFDIIKHIWNIGHILLHAEKMANKMKTNKTDAVNIHFQFLYTGLKDRVVRSTRPHLAGERALRDEVFLKADILSNEISARLNECLYPIATELCDAFRIGDDWSDELVDEVVKKLR